MTDEFQDSSAAPGRHQTVIILDFGSQYTQLIARRVRENRVYCEIQPYDFSAEEIRQRNPIGVILSGGPQSVYEQGAPQMDAGIFELGIPVLGICYGMHLAAHQLGGRGRRLRAPRVRSGGDRCGRDQHPLRWVGGQRDRVDEPR